MIREQRLAALFAVIRAEARRNRRFAAELDRALRWSRPTGVRLKPQPAPETVKAEKAQPPIQPPPQEAPAATLHPVAMLRREGAAALRAALEGVEEGVLRALLQEHNLDPAGAAEQEAADALVDRIVRAAEKRLERDLKLFAY